MRQCKKIGDRSSFGRESMLDILAAEELGARIPCRLRFGTKSQEFGVQQRSVLSAQL